MAIAFQFTGKPSRLSQLWLTTAVEHKTNKQSMHTKQNKSQEMRYRDHPTHQHYTSKLKTLLIKFMVHPVLKDYMLIFF